MVAIFRRAQRAADTAYGRYERRVARARRRSPAFDNLWRAKDRWAEVLGGRLAAAIAYYGFFAVYALALVAYAIVVNWLGDNKELVADIDDFLATYLPGQNFASVKSQSYTIAGVGLVSLIFTGIGWVDAWRSSQRAIWHLDQHPGNVVVRRLVDLGLLTSIGVLLGVSLAATGGLTALLESLAGGPDSIWMELATHLLTFAFNLIIGITLLTVLPRLRLSLRRVMPATLLVGTGITLLNTVGRLVVARTADNPAYVVVTSSVGLLVYLYLFNQIVLFGTAVAATARHGTAIDMAAGPGETAQRVAEERAAVWRDTARRVAARRVAARQTGGKANPPPQGER